MNNPSDPIGGVSSRDQVPPTAPPRSGPSLPDTEEFEAPVAPSTLTSSEIGPPVENPKLTQPLPTRRSTRSAEWGTWMISLLILIVYVCTHSSLEHALPIGKALDFGGNFAPKLSPPSAEWWRLVTSTFLHWDTGHLLSNLAAFFLLAREVERLIKAFGLTILFLCCSSLANTSTLFFYPDQVSIGASGGIYGLVSALAAFSVVTRGERLKDVRLRTALVVIWLLFALTTNLNSPWVDNANHIFGLMSGLLLGVMIAPLYGLRGLSTFQTWGWKAIPLGFTLGTIMLSLAQLPPPLPIFTFLETYQEEELTLKQALQSWDTLTPLERRARWEQDLLPRLELLERELETVSRSAQSRSRSEIKLSSDALQWSLWRMLESWRATLSHHETTQETLDSTHDATTPPEIQLKLYSDLISQQQLHLLLEPSWDERIFAFTHPNYWTDLHDSKVKRSRLAYEIIAEASSPEVREKGSLWADGSVRAARLAQIKTALELQLSKTELDWVTLVQIAWLEGEMTEVIKQAELILWPSGSNPNQKPLKNEFLRKKVASIWMNALISTPLKPLTQPVRVNVHQGQLTIADRVPRSSLIYFTADQCSPRGQSQEASRERSHPMLIEVISAKQEHTAKNLFLFEGHDDQQAPCLTHVHPLGWLPSSQRNLDTTKTYRAYELQLPNRSSVTSIH